MKILKFGELLENKDILDMSNFHKIDYYYLDDNIDLSIIREKKELIEDNTYRGFATFLSNIEHFKHLDCIKIALINYPPLRYTKRNLVAEIEKAGAIGVDEIEFPWNNKYFFISKEDWKDIIFMSQQHGMKLRPMLEFGVWDKEYIIRCIDFFKEIGIMSIMCSTGLVQDMMTYEKWSEMKEYMPRFFETKVAGLLTVSDINKFLKDEIDLCATTIDFSNNEIK